MMTLLQVIQALRGGQPSSFSSSKPHQSSFIYFWTAILGIFFRYILLVFLSMDETRKDFRGKFKLVLSCVMAHIRSGRLWCRIILIAQILFPRFFVVKAVANLVDNCCLGKAKVFFF